MALDELLVELMRRLDLGDLAPRARDRLAHLDQLGEHVARRGLPRLLRLEHGRSSLAIASSSISVSARAVAAGIFGQEPAAARSGRERVLDRRVVCGERSAAGLPLAKGWCRLGRVPAWR